MGNAQTVNSKMSFGGYEIAEMTKTTTHSTLSFKNAKVTSNSNKPICFKWVYFTMTNSDMNKMVLLMVNDPKRKSDEHTFETLNGETILIEYDKEEGKMYPVLHFYSEDGDTKLHFMNREELLILFKNNLVD